MPVQSDHHKLTDHELVAKSLADQEFFGLLIQRYEAKLTRYIW